MERSVSVSELVPGQLVRLLYSPVLNALGTCVWARHREVEAADPSKRRLVDLGFLLADGRLVKFSWHPAMKADLLDEQA